MSNHKALTNEELNKRFENPFKMVNYAIGLAHDLIARGEERETNPIIDVMLSLESCQDMIKPIAPPEEETPS